TEPRLNLLSGKHFWMGIQEVLEPGLIITTFGISSGKVCPTQRKRSAIRAYPKRCTVTTSHLWFSNNIPNKFCLSLIKLRIRHVLLERQQSLKAGDWKTSRW